MKKVIGTTIFFRLLWDNKPYRAEKEILHLEIEAEKKSNAFPRSTFKIERVWIGPSGSIELKDIMSFEKEKLKNLMMEPKKIII